MNTRSVGFLITGGLALLLVVFIAAMAFLLATENAPFHLEIREPVNTNQTVSQPQNVTLPQQVRQLDPEYVLTDIYALEDAPLPEFRYVNTGTDGNTVNENGVEPSTGISFSGGRVFVNGEQVGLLSVPATGEVRTSGSGVTIGSTKVSSGYVDIGATGGVDDNVASIVTTDGYLVVAEGWFSYSDGDTTTLALNTRRDVDVSGSNDVVIIGGTTIVTGLADGADTCQATVITARTVDATVTSPEPLWGAFTDSAAEVRLSGLLSFFIPLEDDEVFEINGTLYVDTGDNGDWDGDASTGDGSGNDGHIVRNADGTPNATADSTAVRLATLPLPTARSDIDDGFVSMPLEVGTRVALADYGDGTEADDETPPIRESQLVITIPELNALQCGTISGVRWEQPTLGTITVRNAFDDPLLGYRGLLGIASSNDTDDGTSTGTANSDKLLSASAVVEYSWVGASTFSFTPGPGVGDLVPQTVRTLIFRGCTTTSDSTERYLYAVPRDYRPLSRVSIDGGFNQARSWIPVAFYEDAEIGYDVYASTRRLDCSLLDGDTMEVLP